MTKILFKPLQSLCCWSAILGLLVLTVLTVPVAGQVTGSSSQARAIVSPFVPMDSRGETVYEFQGEQQDHPVVAGALLPPVPVKIPEPKFPKSLRASRSSADVVVEGVATTSGDFIDAKIIGHSDPGASANALAAVSKYKFNPATLDGKPVAFRTRVTVSFHYQ